MCVTPARCFPATPLQLYSSTNPHHAGKRLFRVTLYLLFQSCILAFCKKISSCSSSYFTTQSLAWCNHRIPRCLLSGPNDTTVVDYHCTETIPMGPPHQISLSFLLFVLFFLFLEIRLWNWTHYSRLRECFMWVLNCFNFSLCYGQHLCLNINSFFCVSVQFQQQWKPLKEERTELIPMMLLKSRGEVNLQVLIFLTSLPSKCCHCPKKRVFPRDSPNSDPTRPENV